MSTMKVHYFRNLFHGEHDIFMTGTHGNNAKKCKACVKVIAAVFEDTDGSTYLGLSFRNPKDQINRKIGRSIAIGRCMKNAKLGVKVDGVELKKVIDKLYLGAESHAGVKTELLEFLANRGFIL